MGNILNNFFTNNVRLIDVFITGPLQIYISTFLKILFFKYFMLVTGILNISFNGYIFLLKSNYIKKLHPFLKLFISENGKYQIHRFYNLSIMYPIFLYIILNFKLPLYLRVIFCINIIFGFSFNLYNFISIRQKLLR